MTPARERLVWLAATGAPMLGCLYVAMYVRPGSLAANIGAVIAGVHFGACVNVIYTAWKWPPMFASVRCPHAMLWCAVLDHDWRDRSFIPPDGGPPVEHHVCRRCALEVTARWRAPSTRW